MNTIIYPRVSEKSYALATNSNVYVFNVPKDCNKIEVKKAIEGLYSVTVTTVNIMNTKGKVKRTVKKGGRQTNGRRSDYRKAYVTLKKGQSIPIFATEEKEKQPKKGKK
jgi:large subunit ribosomal protein L23